MTNWFDPDTAPVRLVLVFVMLASLLMAVAIPEGFGEHALLFACAYSGLQIGRNAFVVAVTPRGSFNQNFRQILAWSVLSAPLWVAGGVVDADAWRWVLWLGALGLDLAGAAGDVLAPGRGHHADEPVADRGRPFRRALPAVRDHRARREHRARGATASDTGLSVEVVAALLLAFLSSTALWWLYFGQVAEHGAGADPRGHGRASAARSAATSTPICTSRSSPGIVLVAVGDELVIAHPTDDLHDAGALVALGGPALFLAA